MQAFVPLKVGKFLQKWRPEIDVTEAGWYQTLAFEQGIEVTLLPAQHWNRRSLFDTNTALWGSYLITDGNTTIYVAGDTGYANHFKLIGSLFSSIDHALLPIGSYEPAHLHHNSHMTPEEAIIAFRDLGANTMIPVHYGTYDLSDEPVSEPLSWLKAEMVKDPSLSQRVKILSIGEAHSLN